MIELSDYIVASKDAGIRFAPIDLTISAGDVCRLHAVNQSCAALLLRALATFEYPTSGTYRFQGCPLDFSGYRPLLPIKQRIGYIVPNAGIIANRTVRENLLLRRFYYENSLSQALDDYTLRLCRLFRMETKLDCRPGMLMPLETRTAVAIRELSKPIELLLIDQPEEMFGQKLFDAFIVVMEEVIAKGIPIIFSSNNRLLNETYANRVIEIKKSGESSESTSLFKIVEPSIGVLNRWN